MAEESRWIDLVGIRRRFQRSVHLERDFGQPGALKGYVITPLVRAVVGRIGVGLLSDSGSKAWSITGPYGSGKSALALFLSELFAPAKSRKEWQAWELLKHEAPEVATRMKSNGHFTRGEGLCAVLATGERRPLEQTLLLALNRSMHAFWSGRGVKPNVLRRVEKLAKAAAVGHTLPVSEVVGVFEDAAEKIALSRAHGFGLLVILDEAGKALEHAAQATESGDIQLLQELAEAANRSQKHPLVFVTLLHQALDQYAGRLGSAQRREWSKVQGRFEDIPFQEDPSDILRLIANAIEHVGPHKRFPRSMWSVAKATTSTVTRLVSTGVFRDQKGLQELLLGVVPLHPATALVLGPFFRSELAQNERSLFAFLSSGEPRGFQEFLASVPPAPRPHSFYPIDRLYDYILAAYGGRLTGHQGRQIAAVEEAIRRVPTEGGDLDVRLLKVIGLLGALGDATGLVASEEVFQVSLGDGGRASRADIRRAVDRLQAGSLIVYRKYRDAYQLWEGSDLNLEAMVRSAARQIDPSTGLIARLNRVMQARPVVARRHLLTTGTLRYFPVQYVDDSGIDAGPPIDLGTGDGLIRIVLARDGSTAEKPCNRMPGSVPIARYTDRSRPELVGVATNPRRLLEVGLDVAALEWVQSHTPELQTDRIARRELSARLAEAEQRMRTEADRLLWDEEACRWSFRGENITVRRPRDLTRAVSDICDRVYRKAPYVHNELLNRPFLSSSAAAARRLLLKGMIENSRVARLGAEGFPPEYAMYRSLLEEHGLHRQEDGAWSIAPPVSRKRGSLVPAWEAIGSRLTRAEGTRIGLGVLYDELRAPPYGMKDGVVPVVVLAYALKHDNEIALYEDGTFVSGLTINVVERMLRSPERFELQHYRIEGARAAFLDRLAGPAGAAPGLRGEQQLLPVVRQLVKFVRQLPDFSRNTRSLSETAQSLRGALLRAREPGPLVFRDLPQALGLDPLDARLPDDDVGVLVNGLKRALRELQLAYSQLLADVEQALGEAFRIEGRGETLRQRLAVRTGELLPLAVELENKAFLLRLCDDRLPQEEWLASVATILANKPPESWHDSDLERARLALALHAQKARALEAVLVGTPGESMPGTRLLRVSVIEKGEAERAHVFALNETGEEGAIALRERLLAAINGHGDLDEQLAAVTLTAQTLLRQHEDVESNAPATRHRMQVETNQ